MSKYNSNAFEWVFVKNISVGIMSWQWWVLLKVLIVEMFGKSHAKAQLQFIQAQLQEVVHQGDLKDWDATIYKSECFHSNNVKQFLHAALLLILNKCVLASEMFLHKHEAYISLVVCLKWLFGSCFNFIF